MKKMVKTAGLLIVAALISTVLSGPRSAMAANAEEIDRDARAALKTLYDTTPAASA